MIRVFACIVSFIAITSFATFEQANAQQGKPQGKPAAAAPRPAPAPRAAAPAPRMAAPRAVPHAAPRMAGPRPAPAPRFAAPRHVSPQPRMAGPRPNVSPRIANTPRPQFNRNAARDNARSAREAAKANRDAARNAARSKNVPNAPQLASSPKPQNTKQLNPRELRAQQRLQRQQTVNQQRIDRLQQRANAGKLNPRAQRELNRLQARQQQFNKQQQAIQPQNSQAQQANRNLRKNGKPRITADAARQGRFAARFHNPNNPNWQARRAARIAARVAARQAWRHHRRAAFVAWAGPVFWPYAYSDIFDYTFWPYAYDDAYWAYAYDDMFDSVYWAGGSPYADDYYVGPYASVGGYAAAVPGGRPTARSRQIQQSAQQLCKDPGKGITAWPFERIDEAVRPNAEQRGLLDDVKAAAAKAADEFKASCSDDFPMTPPGRLQAMINRLQATLGAVRTVRPPLERFYASLNDEQKARFNAIGPDIGQEEARAASKETQGRGSDEDKACGGGKAGLSSLPIEAIEDAVNPTGDQEKALNRLNEATDKAIEALQAACPDVIPLTPVGRLEVMEQRLDAMVNAANTIRPALEDFYASLNNEQKAAFNQLGSKQAKQ